MAKDPATLWYWNDWHGGTITMSRHLKGCYMDLLHAQFNCGRLTLDDIKNVLNVDFLHWETLQKKFLKDDDGFYYNARAEDVQEKRRAFTQSRRLNLMGKKMKNSPKELKVFHPQVVELTSLLLKMINENDPKARKPNLNKWNDEMDKLMRIDGRTPKEIEKVILFCQKDHFWKTNILSAGKLRDKFHQLKLKSEQVDAQKRSLIEYMNVDDIIREDNERREREIANGQPVPTDTP